MRKLLLGMLSLILGLIGLPAFSIYSLAKYIFMLIAQFKWVMAGSDDYDSYFWDRLDKFSEHEEEGTVNLIEMAFPKLKL